MSADSITVIGAGLAGSLLATRLAQRGFKVALLEKRGDMRRGDISAGRSINLALAARGIHALKLCRVMDQVEPLCIPMPGRQLHPLGGDEQFQPYSGNPDEVNYSVSRAELNKVLLNAAEQAGVELRFNCGLESVDIDAGTFTLRDGVSGHTETRDVVPVIATDGAGSVMRQALAAHGIDNDEAMLSHGYKELTIPPAPDGGWQIERGALHIWPRGGYMLIALPNLDGSFTVTLFLPHEGDTSFASLNTPAKVDAFFNSEFPDAHALIPDLTETFFANPTGHMGTVRCRPWHHDGTALLFGDAAHAIVPFHGQGMNAAFEDVTVFDTCLDEFGTDWESVFAAFSERRKPDADAIADMALENYVEMRDTVRDPKFHLQKALGWELERRHPKAFIPRYSMVMFHPEIPYSEAYRRGSVQKEVLAELTANTERLEEVDMEKAEALIRERLT